MCVHICVCACVYVCTSRIIVFTPPKPTDLGGNCVQERTLCLTAATLCTRLSDHLNNILQQLGVFEHGPVCVRAKPSAM